MHPISFVSPSPIFHRKPAAKPRDRAGILSRMELKRIVAEMVG